MEELSRDPVEAPKSYISANTSTTPIYMKNRAKQISEKIFQYPHRGGIQVEPTVTKQILFPSKSINTPSRPSEN